jgi:hypothetical protein
MSNEIDISTSNKKTELTTIKHMVRNLELKLQGYVWSANADKMIYTGSPLAKKRVINSATSLLQSFCDNANLITSKDKLTIFKQKWEINSTFNKVLARNIGDNTDNYDVIMKSFKATFQNILDIIKDSKDLMTSFYGNEENKDLTPMM